MDRKFYFDNHVNTICRRASKKLTVLARLSNVLPFYQMKIWVFCSRMRNNKINEPQERSLRILYKDDCFNFEELLRKNNSLTIHIRNIQLQAIEMYKLKNNLSLNFISCLFNEKNILIFEKLSRFHETSLKKCPLGDRVSNKLGTYDMEYYTR